MIIYRQYVIRHRMKAADAFRLIRQILAENKWHFGEIRMEKHGCPPVVCLADEAEERLGCDKNACVCIDGIDWQNFTMPDGYAENPLWAPESIRFVHDSVILRIVRTGADKQDIRIAEIISRGMDRKITEPSSIVHLSAQEENIPPAALPPDIPFQHIKLRKASAEVQEKGIYTCSMAQLLRCAEIHARFSLSIHDGSPVIWTRTPMGHMLKIIFSSDKNRAFLSGGTRLNDPTLCSGYYITPQKNLHVFHRGIEAENREDVKAFVRDCICLGDQAAAWLDAHAEEISPLSVPPWLDL